MMSEGRRKQLIEATVTCIALHGLSGTTLRKVSQQAGLSLGLVNFHFATKDVLLEETLRTLAEEHRVRWKADVMRADLDAEEKIHAIVDAQFHPRICTRKKLAVWFAFFGEARYRKFYRKITADIDEERIEVSRALFAEIAENSEMSRSPEELALALESLFDGTWLNILMYPDAFSKEAARDQVLSYLALCCPGRFMQKR